MTGLEAVLSRIAAIESRFAPAQIPTYELAELTTGTGTHTGSTGGAASSATAFAQTLSSLSPTNGQLGAQAVQQARTYLGVPYRWGGTNPATGLDCSGLVQRVYANLGVTLPRTAAQQATAGSEVPDLAAARPGDLIVFRGGHHVGIYIGDGQMIHAPSSGKKVRVAPVSHGGSMDTIRRIGSAAGPAASTAQLGAAARAQTSTSASGALSTYQSLFDQASSKYQLPTGLLRAVATVESGGNPRAISPAGARGLMQIMPATARGLGVDPMDPKQAIDGAARLLRQGLRDFGSLDLALASYNAGPGAVRRYGGVPPYAETQSYVRKVTALLPGGTA